MRILFVIDSLGPGGAQRQMVELAKQLVNHGNIVSFLVYHRIDFYKPELEKVGIGIHYIIESSYALRLHKIRRYMRSGRFDAVLSFLQSSSFICEVSAFPYRSWKLIVGERSANPNIFKSPRLRFYRWFHLLADYVVSNSQANIEMVKKLNPFLNKSKLKVIYNMVGNDLFKTHIRDRTISKDILEVVVGASHRGLKNSIGMVEAVHALRPEFRRKLKIKWYGDSIVQPYVDSSFPNALQLVKSYGLQETIEFYPATKDFLKHMSNADVVALFSFYEGLPNVICEAMAMGKPVMSSNVSDIPLILEHNLNQVFDPNNVDSIRRCFEYYLELGPTELRKIGLTNREVAAKLFSEELVVSEYLKLLEK